MIETPQTEQEATRQDKGLITVGEFLKRVPVNRERLYLHLKTGRLPSYNFGRKILLDFDECLEAMRTHARNPKAPEQQK